MRATQVMAPESDSASMMMPMASPPPYKVAAGSFWAMTSAAMAFSGCTGMGMRYHRPVRICIRPNAARTLAESSRAARIMPTMRGRSVPMSPKAPDSS